MCLPATLEIAAAIEQLYTTFGTYALPPSTHPCPCCHSVDSERPLYSRPLRRLTPEDLEEYANDALLVWGGVNEFRHFLPRIFEILVSADHFSLADPEIVISKLEYGGWRSWPEEEQEAIKAFLLAVWRAALQLPPPEDLAWPPEIESWLCALAQAGGDLSPYLNEWLESALSSSSAVWNLAAIIYRTGMPQARPQGINAFWNEHMDQVRQVSEWLHSAAVREKLEKAVEMYSNEPFAEELLAAVGVVS